MKYKITFLNQAILKEFYSFLSVISVVFSIFLVFFEISPQCKIIAGLFFSVILFCIYLYLWYDANHTKSINCQINNSIVEIKFGDLFVEEGLKVIAFNEYLDTIVDNKIISENSLNGKFIKKHLPIDAKELDELIKKDVKLNDNFLEENTHRRHGKKKKYNLGSSLEVDGFIITALTHFDENNKAYVKMNDYISFLIKFWDEIDRIYSGRTIVLPLLGAGLTRFRGYEDISDQEILELLIWSFKVSRIKFTYPSRIKIILDTSKCDKIDLFSIKQKYS